jgi:hypothetical protein
MPSVFISHAGGDRAIAVQVADALHGDGINVRLDRLELEFGESFLTFMQEALSTSDYCLLLWSKRAASTPWVRMEWESALHRSVTEKRAFLVVGRLEDTELPILLAPRLYCDLFPSLRPGLTALAACWRADRDAEAQTKKPVGQASSTAAPVAGASTLYITSDLFGITVPWKIDLNKTADALLGEIVTRYNLPAQIDYQGLIGLRIRYELMHHDHRLDEFKSLESQSVLDRDVVWIQTTSTQFADTPALAGHLSPVQYRDGTGTPRPLREAVIKAGLGPGRPVPFRRPVR